MRRLMAGLLMVLGLSGCGDTNFNEMLLVSEGQKKASDQLLLEARYSYDKGNLGKAMSLVDQADRINPYNEDTLVLKAYIYLSQAGLDAFSISKNLIAQSEKKSETTSSSDKTSESFSALGTLMNLTSDDLSKMGTPTPVASANNIVLYYPFPAAEARAGGSATITSLNQAIATLCPLISDAAKSSDDERHVCDEGPYPIQRTAKSNFAWALAHLGEAIAFYTVVLYDDGNLVPNIQDVASGIDRNDISKLVARVTTLQAAVNSIFPTGTDANKSMLNALFDDLDTTNRGFSAIAGIPASVTKSVSDTIENLRAQISKIGGSLDDASAQNEALRNSLTKGLSTDLKSKIEASTSLSNDDKIKACCAYRAINTQAANPTNCASIADSQCTQL